MSAAPDIFLSYTRDDQVTAKRVAEAFEAQGFSVWWDVTLRSGEAYDEVTEQALRDAKAVVVLWSKKSVVSRWVRAEATLADRNRTLVPARIEPCDLPIMFELTQTADLSHWTFEANDNVWCAFLADVRQFVEVGEAPKRPSPLVAATASPPPPHGTRPSIAVLPFINRSGLQEDNVFADGMVEDLTAALSVSRRMKVVASSSTRPYRTAAVDLRQIGRDLGVRYLLEGNVRRVGNDLRVTAQVVEAESGNILWTQKFDRPLSKLSILQEDLVIEVASRLGTQVERVEMEHALKKPGNISAWEAVVRADANSLRFTRSGMETAVAEARRAIKLDPNYGAAYATLAATQGQLLLERGDNDPELSQEILDNIRRARALDTGNPLVLCRIAAAFQALRKPLDALSLLDRAMVINPNLEFVRALRGAILVQLGQWDDAIADLDAADRLAPNGFWVSSSSIFRSAAHLQAGRLDLALEEADRSVRLFPSTRALTQCMLCLAKRHDWDRARDTLRRLRDTDPELSPATVEGFVRRYNGGSKAVDDYIVIARKLWDETSSEPRSQ
jgi:TolB-like protein